MTATNAPTSGGSCATRSSATAAGLAASHRTKRLRMETASHEGEKEAKGKFREEQSIIVDSHVKEKKEESDAAAQEKIAF